MKDSEIDDLLRSASEPISLPDSFRRGVWQRIEAAELARPSAAEWLRAPLRWLLQPWAGAVSVAAAVAIGLGLGAIFPSGSRDAEANYFRSINPFETHEAR